MFTIGAFVTPMLIAASIHFLRGQVWPAYHTLAFISILEAFLLPLLPSPPPPRMASRTPRGTPSAASGGDTDTELETIHETVPLAKSSGGGKARLSDAELDAVGESSSGSARQSPTGKATPATTSKAKRLVASGGWVYLGDPGSEALPRHVVVMVRAGGTCLLPCKRAAPLPLAPRTLPVTSSARARCLERALLGRL